MVCQAEKKSTAGVALHSDSGDQSSGTLFSFGNGSQGQLGCDATADSYTPERVPVPEIVVGIAAGHYHSLAWTSEGQLYSWGRNNEQQLGRVPTDEDAPFGASLKPGHITGLSTKVVGCAASGVASIAVGTDGCLYSFGKSKRGQLGLGEGRTAADVPERIPGCEGVTAVSCGWGHALALTEDGGVLSWGFPSGNRLGNLVGDSTAEMSEQEALDSCVWSPRRVLAFEGLKAKQVCCSLDSSMVLAEDGTLYTFGDNSLGQLGHPSRPERCPEDWIVRGDAGAPLKFERVASGLGHCLAVTQDGQVMVWGWKHGLSGLPETLHVPALVPFLPDNPSARLAAGRVHSLVATVSDPESQHLQGLAGGNDVLYAFGNGQNGRLGLGSSQSAGEPEVVQDLEGLSIQDIACGHDHNLVLTS
ncbi:probable ultraviolet-B receptor UVR8 [Coccomyxa sp. Obi]|nr:probable ultraviolet-B receptor UVR8 [Coccomyxa sp. Obi]